MFRKRGKTVNCPFCQSQLELDKSAKEIICTKCKSRVPIPKADSLVQEFFSLFVKIGDWFESNWKKVVTKVEKVILSESVIYESRCWNCKKPIRSVRTESKFKRWVGNKWLGNEKCPKPDCNYFLCTSCGKCLCDGPYSYKKSQKPFLKKWVQTSAS